MIYSKKQLQNRINVLVQSTQDAEGECCKIKYIYEPKADDHFQADSAFTCRKVHTKCMAKTGFHSFCLSCSKSLRIFSGKKRFGKNPYFKFSISKNGKKCTSILF
jgi:hypothetical protein